MKLNKDEDIITAYAESSSGPGWATNQPIWVIVKNRLTGIIRKDCIQPRDQTEEMQILCKISEAAHVAMTNAVKRKI